MDDRRFDDLAKMLAAGGTRRSFLRGMGAVLSLTLPIRQAAAQPEGKGCKREGKNCKRDDQCCSGWCSPYSGSCAEPGGDIPFIDECVTHADCDDGDPCTHDACGDLSQMCFHDPIPGCQRCTGSGRCPHGGSCCDGRCCPEGSVCMSDPLGTGRDTCCDPCGGGMCCDRYGQLFEQRGCLDDCGYCCPWGNGSCVDNGIGELVPNCIAPGISR